MISQAGELDRKVTLQRPVGVKSSTGAKKPEFEAAGTVWAKRQDEKSGISEGQEAHRLTAISQVSFIIRWRADVKPTWQLLSDGEVYDIEHVAPDGRKHWLVLRCKRHD